jgi:glycosyltransferase involved in cell wall biosynthesis
MRLAFVHDWFKANGGAEKVAGAILDAYAGHDITIYTLFDCFTPADRAELLKNYPIKVSMLQRIPGIGSIYRYLLPVMPWVMGRFNLVGYDLILSTSHAVAKGFRSDGALHICYCHTPMRYVWDMYDDYAAGHSMGRSRAYRAFINYIRRWDLRSAANVHYFIANSHHVQQRISKHYGRESVVIYPPVRVEKFALNTAPRKDYYMCMGRMVPYKKIDLIARAFRHTPDKKLLLVGEGYGSKLFRELLQQAPNVQWLGYRSDTELVKLMQEAKACIFAAKEDFGIMCVEVQACGTPVLALDYGGYRETVVDGLTGYLFPEQTEEAIVAAVQRMEQEPLTNYAAIRVHALKFSDRRFEWELRDFVAQCQSTFKKQPS